MTVHEAPWAQARMLARGLASRLPAEQVPVASADRRVLAERMTALIDLPRFDASAMDGWAVRGAEPWRVVGSVHAGDSLPAPLEDGTAVAISTGAPVPEGTTGIVRTEDGADADGKLTGVGSARDVRRAGEECREGDVLAEAGVDLTPTLIGLLAAAGHDLVPVTRRPRVDVIILGNEVQASGLPLQGSIRDALGPQVPAWLVRAGAEVSSTLAVPDSVEALAAALAQASGDLIVTTGSTAAGPRDHLRAAIAGAEGTLVVDQVASRPGHPMLLAEIRGLPLVALPGNPQAAVVSLLTLGFPLVDALLGRPERPLDRVPLAEEVTGFGDRIRLIAGTVTPDGFRASRHDGPAMLRGVAASTGYAVIPLAGAAAGERVDWLPLP